MEDYTKKHEERERERLLQRTIEKRKFSRNIACIILMLILFISFLLAFLPIYGVWSQRLAGEAELAHAESNRQIRILEAKAEQESAKALAEAEITRAEGVAKANKIIGGSLQNNEGYLRYLWIHGLKTNQMQVIYVPTEANLPILEASKRPSERK